MAEQGISKGAVTRERILNEAMLLFAVKGYTQTTMREIAAKAGCSLGLAYRYFKSKDVMVLALYERMVTELADDVARLPRESMATRWGRAIRGDFARLQSNRLALTGLISAGLTPGSATQVLGRDAASLRDRMLAIFREIAVNSTDAARGQVADALPTLFYALHLVLILFWLQDPTPGQRATHQLIDCGEQLLGRFRFVLRLPWVADWLADLSGILAPLLSTSHYHAETGESGE